MPVSSEIAEYLKNEALFVSVESSLSSTWAARAVESEIISPLVYQNDAETENDRQIAFLDGPLVEDLINVNGARRDLFGKVITVTGDRLGYVAGVPAFVIGYTELKGTTDLSIIRAL